MKNIDKIAHLDNMIEKLKGQIKFSHQNLEQAISEGANTMALESVIESWKMDLASLKYGRKAIQLMVDLVNDVEDEGGQQ